MVVLIYPVWTSHVMKPQSLCQQCKKYDQSDWSHVPACMHANLQPTVSISNSVMIVILIVIWYKIEL